jgi:hypothetical protein
MVSRARASAIERALPDVRARARGDDGAGGERSAERVHGRFAARVLVCHDHFVGAHGGAVVLDVRSEEERALLDDPGPLGGWEMAVHPLTFSLSAVGFAAQTLFRLESYRGVSFDDLAASEPDDPRFWWKRRSQ